MQLQRRAAACAELRAGSGPDYVREVAATAVGPCIRPCQSALRTSHAVLILSAPLTRQRSRLRWVPLCLCDISGQSHPKLTSDVAGGLYDADTVDKKVIRRAALITLRRAICDRFPSVLMHKEGLRWIAGLGAICHCPPCETLALLRRRFTADESSVSFFRQWVIGV
jgi:hypothetical protein